MKTLQNNIILFLHKALMRATIHYAVARGTTQRYALESSALKESYLR